MIRFTNRFTNKNVYVNPGLITSIGIFSSGVSIFFDGNAEIQVIESEDDVIAKLYGAELDSYTRTGAYSRL